MSFEDELMKEFPQFFLNERAFGGISVGKGWEKLIRQLCKDIDNLYKVNNQSVVRKRFQITQIKEKFGGLRFYGDYVLDDRMLDLIDKAEGESLSICENCGAEGELIGEHWVKTLCDICKKEDRFARL